jgi:hypothetical protein
MFDLCGFDAQRGRLSPPPLPACGLIAHAILGPIAETTSRSPREPSKLTNPEFSLCRPRVSRSAVPILTESRRAGATRAGRGWSGRTHRPDRPSDRTPHRHRSGALRFRHRALDRRHLPGCRVHRPGAAELRGSSQNLAVAPLVIRSPDGRFDCRRRLTAQAVWRRLTLVFVESEVRRWPCR